MILKIIKKGSNCHYLKGSNCHIDMDSGKAYSYDTCIGVKIFDTWYFDSIRYSVTTLRHISGMIKFFLGSIPFNKVSKTRYAFVGQPHTAKAHYEAGLKCCIYNIQHLEETKEAYINSKLKKWKKYFRSLPSHYDNPCPRIEDGKVCNLATGIKLPDNSRLGRKLIKHITIHRNMVREYREYIELFQPSSEIPSNLIIEDYL